MNINEEKDDFWNIEKLIPKRKTQMHPFVSKPMTSEITVPGEDAPEPDDSGSGRLTTENHGNAYSERSYTPAKRGFIHKVTVRRFNDRYDFYGNFRKAALIYYDYSTPKSRFEPFYSYMPQYSQLTQAQRDYYFYWRHELREGRYIKSDYSYVYLYVYEILNLPDKFPPEDGLRALVDVWCRYRSELPKLDLYLSAWVQDYCLMYGLECPMDRLSPFIFDVISASSFKEFYLSDIDDAGEHGVLAMMACLSDYDWNKGKYAHGENAAGYRRHMEGAMGRLITELWHTGHIIGTDAEPTTLVRDAFPASLCTHTVKSKLIVEYYPLSGAEKLRSAITDAVRYTENKLRTALGVKSRLSIKNLPDDYRRIIDSYFDGLYGKTVAVARETPEYEKLYEADETCMSTSGADEIERSSWTTTMRLIPEEEKEEIEETTRNADKNSGSAINSTNPHNCEGITDSEYWGLSPETVGFLRAVLGGESPSGISGADAARMADVINEAFSDNFGDIIIEFTERGYEIIEDYKEDVEKWLNR